MSQNISFENASIGYKNFSGKEGPYNAEGELSFSIFMDPERAMALEKEGWNIKWPKEREGIDPDNDDRRPRVDVSIGMKFPPTIQLLTHFVDPNGEEQITSKKLDPANFGAMDFMEYTSVDIIIRPYNWAVNGNTGIKAYLKTMYVNMVIDEFEAKYGLDPASKYR